MNVRALKFCVLINLNTARADDRAGVLFMIYDDTCSFTVVLKYLSLTQQFQSIGFVCKWNCFFYLNFFFLTKWSEFSFCQFCMLPHKHELILYIFNKRLYSHRRSFFSASLEFVCVTQPSCQFPVKCTFDSHSTLNKKVHEVFLASFACKVFTKHYSGLVQLAARPSLMASSRPEKLDSEIQMV